MSNPETGAQVETRIEKTLRLMDLLEGRIKLDPGYRKALDDWWSSGKKNREALEFSRPDGSIFSYDIDIEGDDHSLFISRQAPGADGVLEIAEYVDLSATLGRVVISGDDASFKYGVADGSGFVSPVWSNSDIAVQKIEEFADKYFPSPETP